MRKILTLPKFVKEMGFSRANDKVFHEHLKYLLRTKTIEIQQGGFLGDSMHHPKLVVIRDFTALQIHFQKTFITTGQQLETEPEKVLHVDFAETQIESVKTQKNVEYYEVGQFGKTFYLRLGPEMIRFHHPKKGDIIKFQLLELRRAPEEGEED